MELEEMQRLWADMSQKVEQQQRLTDQLILQMTQQNYRTAIGKISSREMLGTVFCLIGAVYLGANLGKMDTWYLMAACLYSILHMVLLPLYSLRTLFKLQRINIQGNSMKQTLLDFAKAKKKVFLAQKVGLSFNVILLLLCLPVFAKISSGNDLFLIPETWYWYAPIGVLSLGLMSWWLYKQSTKSIAKAEVLLRGLEED